MYILVISRATQRFCFSSSAIECVCLSTPSSFEDPCPWVAPRGACSLSQRPGFSLQSRVSVQIRCIICWLCRLRNLHLQGKLENLTILSRRDLRNFTHFFDHWRSKTVHTVLSDMLWNAFSTHAQSAPSGATITTSVARQHMTPLYAAALALAARCSMHRRVLP